MKSRQSRVGPGLQADAPAPHVALRPSSTGCGSLLYLPRGTRVPGNPHPRQAFSRDLVGTELCSSPDMELEPQPLWFFSPHLPPQSPPRGSASEHVPKITFTRTLTSVSVPGELNVRNVDVDALVFDPINLLCLKNTAYDSDYFKFVETCSCSSPQSVFRYNPCILVRTRIFSMCVCP